MNKKRNELGVAMVEYVKVLALVTIGMAAAVAALGRLLLRYFDLIDGLIALPFP